MILSLLLTLFQSEPMMAGGIPPPRNVLIIVLDDVARLDLSDVSALGGTPNLDALAAQGVTFNLAYSNGVCSPSRRSLVFGRYWSTGVGPLCGGFSSQTPQLAETSIAETMPFHASAVLGKWHLGGDPTGGLWECAPMAHGFDYWVAGSSFNVNGGGCGGSGYTNWKRVDPCSSALVTTYEPTEVRDAFLAGWQATVPPKFGLFAANLAHGPFHRPPDELLPLGWPATPTQLSKFHAMIAAYDTLIGQMLASVSLQYTMVIVVGDNGTPDTLDARAKGTCYERGINVPLIVAGGPTLFPGRIAEELVHIADVAATAADWAGTGVPSTWDGVSFLPTLLGYAHVPYHEIVVCASGTGELCARSSTMKLIDMAVDELYDLELDPGETTNVIGDITYAVEKAALYTEINAFKAR